jgi:hypothetical protein
VRAKKNGRDHHDLSRLDEPYLVSGLKAAAAFVAKSSTATATSAWGLWSGLVDSQGASPKFCGVQGFNRGFSFIFRRHFHKSKSARLTGKFVANNVG